MTPHPATRLAVLALIAACSVAAKSVAQSQDEQAALADRERLPEGERGYTYYLSLRPYVGEQAKNLKRAIKLVVASNSRQQILERCVPVEVAGAEHLLRINIQDLGWRREDWDTVAGKRNPYVHGTVAPLVVRGDHLLITLADQVESDSILRLMFGANFPKTIEDVRKFFGVDNDPELRFGMIEGQSGVNKQGMRWVENRPISRGYYWHTEDALKLDKDRDPVEHPDGSFRHDGEEHIWGLPKFSTRFGETGALQFYLLANGKGEIVPRAPVDLVSDSTKFRGYDEIRNPGSCIQCHKDGLNPFTRNEFKELRKDGVPFYALEKQAEQLEAFHLRNLTPEFNRNVLDYKMACTLVCSELDKGATSADVSESFQAAVNEYDKPVNLAKAARELDCTVEKLTEVLYQNQPLPNRMYWWTKGNELQPDGTRSKQGEIPRASFRQEFLGLYDAVHFGKPLNEKPVAVEAVTEKKPAVKAPTRNNFQRGRR